ncbi:MAG: sodium-translocating pyrophosphatase [Candidatus Tectomicrobia bacterium]|uniref:K(+)-insensitive pyrophosphate-energized proton pump n=1 Tax=Tectimicrobiota bacterium TaxID=2528274 RepID=A0A932CNU3_UNCTE|nr:sodium-translocating pyrophosphatase [Candidatus Tectomicrobia bacterium]
MSIPVVIFASCFLALAFAAYLARYVLAGDEGTSQMQEIAQAIREGAEAFMSRQYRTIGLLSLAMAALILGMYGIFGQWEMGWRTSVAFIFGASCSAISGYLGMYISIRANLRTASAVRSSLNRALLISFRAGGVSGMAVVALSLLGVASLFYLYGGADLPQNAPYLMIGYGFGASFVALFAQLGGGIYTKAADVGADIVGKVEAGIPEDDPRNPAVIADLVGDNVGDCAGRGADLFESTAAENIGAMILGVALYPVFGINGILFPLVARSFGLLATIIGILVVRVKEDGDPMMALNRGYYVTSVLAAVGFYIATELMLDNLWFFGAGMVGLLTSVLFVYITQYYTEYKFRPVRSIAEASQTGTATNIITGTSVALECTAMPVMVISAALILSYYMGVWSGLPHGGLYGTAIATMGMLATCAYILAMDTFGPITDNAGGIIEMSQAPEEIRQKTDRLDSVGNTTKALTKGYAVGSAALAAFLLFSAYLEEVTRLGRRLEVVDIAKVEVFVGALLGAMLVYLFSGLAIRAVGKASSYLITEVRRQFREDPQIMLGLARPNYARCVDIVTVGALKEMVVPGILPVLFPLVVGILLKAEAVAALLMVGTIGGILMATFMNNGGGAWDNAKKYIETGIYGGKGSESHKAAVVGDTFGDPLKDTAGPSLHVLIKLLSTITLVLAPLFI